MVKTFKEQIIQLGKTTLLNNREIARIVNCSEKTVSRYAGSFTDRCKFKTSKDVDMFEIQKTVLLPDIHHPYYDERVMDSVGEFMVDYQPHEIVYMGDQLSLDCISGWNKNKPLLKEGQRLIKDYENFDRDILQVHERITGSETRRTFMIGNHEERVNWYIEQHPELEEIIDIDRNLKLTERGYRIVPFKYHATKTLEAFEGNVVYAHVHNPQMYAKVSPVDRKGYHTATSLPCLCNIQPDYKKNSPNFWINGFAIVESLPATGYFNLYTIIIINGSFMFNGKYYGKEL